MCIASSMNLIKLLTVELQENKNIFFLINRLFLLLKSKNWLNEYIFWELELLKLIGYHLELNKIVSSEIIDNKKVYFVKSNSEKKIVPNFLIEKTNDENDYIILLKGLKLIGDFLNKNIFIPNNINYPSLRTDFINSLK